MSDEARAEQLAPGAWKERAERAEGELKRLRERQNWQVDVAEANASRMVADMAEAEVERLTATIARVEALEKKWRDGDQYDQDAATYLRDALSGTEDES